jgi:hypothetical protein
MPRIDNQFSDWPEEHPELCKRDEPCGIMRVIECDGGDWDVLECGKCGKQMRTRCTFDQDMS